MAVIAAPAAGGRADTVTPLANKALAVAVATVAVVAALRWSAGWTGGFVTDLGPASIHLGSGALGLDLSVTPLPVLYGAFMALAVMFPLHLDRGHKLAVTDAVLSASLLSFPPPLAMATVGIGSAAGYLALLALRRRMVWDLLFNSGKSALAVGAGGAAWSLLAPAQPMVALSLQSSVAGWGLPGVAGWGLLAGLPLPSGLGVPTMGTLAALPLAGVVTHLVNTFPVNVAVWLQHGRNPLRGWLIARRADGLQVVGLYLIGVAAALVARQNVWAVPVMAVPILPIYLTLKRTVRVLEQQLDQQTVAAVEAMADAVDLRDPYTAQHCQRVADYATELAQHMGLPAEEVETIRLAARVHDLGKIGIPDHILRKPGALTADERAQIDRHANMGADILCRFADYHGCSELVRRHHVRWDEYEEILDTDEEQAEIERRERLGAQVLAVADSLDAMTSHRPYRQALTLDAAMVEFRRHRGTQWHPVVVDALEALVREPAQERAIRRVRLVPALA